MAKKEEATLLLRIKVAGQDALKKAASFVKASFLAIVAGATAAIHSYREQEEATNRLNQVMVNNGIYSTELARKYSEMATQLQRVTIFGDEAIISAQAQLQAYLGQTEVTEGLVRATLDLATAQGIDLASAASLVGKTIGTSTNALARQGIEVDTNASKQEKLTQVIDKLNGKFGGQAEAAAKGLGSIEKLKNSLSDFMEAVGERLAPLIISWAEAISEFTNDLSTNEGVMRGFTEIFIFAAKTAVVLKNIILGLSEAIAQNLGTAVGAISYAMQGNFKALWESVKSGAKDSADSAVGRYQMAADEMAAIDQSFLDQKQAKQQQELALIAASNEAKRSMAIEQAALDAEDFNVQKLNEQIAQTEHELVMNDIVLQSKLLRINQELALEEDRIKRLALMRQKEKLLEDAANAAKKKGLTDLQAFKAFLNSQEVQDTSSTLSTISTLQSSHNKAAVKAGKAAAIANILISTAQGIAKAWSLGPILGPILSVGVAAAGGAQIAQVTRVGLAEGGIVKATAGGVPATIGEGGRDEAVIPLDDSGGMLGTNISITVNGGLLGDASSARELALALDKEFLKLRQANQSQSLPGVV